jgi:hypothetical protein
MTIAKPYDPALELDPSELTYIDGVAYLPDDLYHCQLCSEPFIDSDELDDDLFCSPCATQAGYEDAHRISERTY